MPSVGHFVVGAAAARIAPAEHGRSHWVWLAGLIALSRAPDLDVLAFRFGIPYGSPFGHRGAAHSILVAVILGAAWATIGPKLGVRLSVALPVAVGVAVSHGLLDALTDGGRGIALLWPISNRRFFAPWQPIPVAPIGMGMLSHRGAAVLLRELILFSPLAVVAVWPRPRKRPGEPAGGRTRG